MRQLFRHLQSDPPRSCGLSPKMHLPVRALKQTLELKPLPPSSSSPFHPRMLKQTLELKPVKPLPPSHLQKNAVCLAHNLRVGTIRFHRSYLRLVTLTCLKLEPPPSLLP
jgi:hypothetical protein